MNRGVIIKNKLIIISLLLTIVFTLSAVSAGNFTDLDNHINKSSDELVLDTDYVYNAVNDVNYTNGINISKSNFLLDGNGHSIDANNQTNKIFTFKPNTENLTFKNLIFKNFNGENAIELKIVDNILLDNVTFINCNASSGVIYINAAYNITVNNSNFISNSGNSASDILALNAHDLIIENSIFDGGVSKWAHFYMMDCKDILVDGCTFQNSQSKYSCGIYLWAYENPYGSLNVRKSKFSNLTVNETAGAIGVKGNITLNIIDCVFSNLIAAKDGGAIYADLDIEEGISNGKTTIDNSTFNLCLAEFGGAIMQLAGTLDIINSTFENNTGLYSGGALWTSHTTLNIDNSTFKENVNNIVREGGTLSIDYADVVIKNSKFIKNTGSGIANAVYTYDTNLTLIKNEFIDNGNAVYSIFGINNIDGDNQFNNDTLSLNNTFYSTVVVGEGIEIKLINNTITVDSLPSRFNLNDWGWVSPVKNQGDMGACWTFGGCGALESALLKATGILYDFSEDNVQNTMLKYSIYGFKDLGEGGGITTALSYFVNWFGPFDSEYDTYDELGKVSPTFDTNQSVHVQDVIFIKPRANATDNYELKKALINYGSLEICYKSSSGEPYYNVKTAAQYYNETSTTNHAVSIVGWDDNYSKDNFLITPPGDGAWIVKNSWDTTFGDNGYFYLSYYDTSFINITPAVAFFINNTVQYNKNYQTDFSGLSNFNEDYKYYTTTYKAIEDDYVAAIGTYFDDAGVEYKFDIYINDELKHSQSGLSPFFGYHTIRLNKYVPISAGDEVEVVFKSDAVPYQTDSRQHYMDNNSFISVDGQNWFSLDESNMTVCLKVYTTDKPIKYDTKLSSTNVNMVYNGGKYCTITLKDENGKVLAGEKITVVINGKTYTKTTNSKGQAKITVNLIPKTYVAKISFEENDNYYASSTTSTIKITKGTPKLTASAKTFKVKTKTKKYTITLKNNKATFLKNTKVTLKVNGKTYSAKTNNKGVATFKITKLTKKGTFKGIIKFAGDSYYKLVSKTVKIKVKK